MAYLNNIHNIEGYKIISGFGNTFVCDKAIDANKTITFPDGWDNDTNLSFKVLFKNGHNCVDASTPMTLNGVAVVVNKYGTLIPLPIHEMDDSGTTKYKSLQANTILEMYYTDNYDGSDTPAYVVIGNPIVLNSTDYTIYADGQREQLKYSTDEVFTGKYWIDGKPIYSKVFTGLTADNYTQFNIPYMDTPIDASLVIEKNTYSDVKCSPIIYRSPKGTANTYVCLAWSTDGNWSTTNGYSITIEYTKTTD